MNSRMLARLLRLRQIQHDMAKVTLVRANDAQQQAELEASRRAEVLRSLQLPDRDSAVTWLAMAASRQSAALAVRDGRELVRIAAENVERASGEWSQARAAARGLERLEQQQQAIARAAEQAREQREQDDRAATAAVAEGQRGEDA
jgi:flagellar biosynthesis chaperone FliJ